MKKLLLAVVGILIAVTSFQLWMTKDAPISGDGPSTVIDSSVQIGGDFTLTDQLGRRVSASDFKGKVMLVFFGFTHCPDICPVTVATLSKTMESLGDKGDRVAPLFITVDPGRDSPEVLKDYLAPFDSRIVGLTGSDEEIIQVQQAYKAYSARASTDVPQGDISDERALKEEEDEDEDDGAPHDHAAHEGREDATKDYTMDHSSYIYLMNENGGFEKIFAYTTSDQELVRAVEALLKD
ncbi:MAG: SCO family protein [Proteobacteria bacterium]|nr:SCO family protein [Pseudomonadota bacterium]